MQTRETCTDNRLRHRTEEEEVVLFVGTAHRGRRTGGSKAAGVGLREPAAEDEGQGKGILKLYDDVQMCGYQDVQVMWEILTKPEMETPKRLKQRKGSIWRLSSWCRRTRFSLMQWKPISETVDEKGKQSLAMS
ncbi:hypothetical protein MUK42_13811 [Musa troglodytarum]|uniref:Uncharacterized protein n=1 Tax=Musa troglodytarum TaxID=320322 RepID=A0A9E7I862_9LILI|nr:hypothetical protein MUK42_13811 [Musa troglodytarum]